MMCDAYLLDSLLITVCLHEYMTSFQDQGYTKEGEYYYHKTYDRENGGLFAAPSDGKP